VRGGRTIVSDVRGDVLMHVRSDSLPGFRSDCAPLPSQGTSR